jgi:hypothetical protein
MSAIPRFTVRRLMIAVAWLCVGLSVARGLYYSFATIYAVGYSESQFRKVHLGMTCQQVGEIMGSPRRKDSTSQRWAGLENWIYSDPPYIADNYWRRWVMFENGKVVAIVDDYYTD